MTRPRFSDSVRTRLRALRFSAGVGWPLAAAALAAGSCTAEAPDSRAEVVDLQVIVAGNSVRIYSVDRAQPTPPAPADPVHRLRWEIVSLENGNTLGSGEVTDPRVVRAEAELDGVEGTTGEVVGSGVLTIRAPNREGELRVYQLADGRWRRIGRDVVPSLPNGVAVLPLIEPSRDVVGAPVPVVHYGDSRGNVNLLVVSEGYRSTDLRRFRQDVDQLVAGLGAVPGFREHWHRFNVYRQDVRSLESGADDPAAGIAVNTAFETGFGSAGLRRCVLPAERASAAVLGWLRGAAAQVRADAVVLLVNSDEYGGCAQPWNHLVTVTRNPDAVRVLAHELGHTLFGLHDEYASDGHRCERDVSGPNVANQLSRLPWADLVNTAELPTHPASAPAGTIGAFEGARWCTHGMYRPQARCMMNQVTDNFCQVCARTIARFFAAREAGTRGDAPAGTLEGVAVRVVNRTGARLWVRCDGVAGASCTDWTLLERGEAATVRTAGRRLALDNQAFTEAAAPLHMLRVVAPSERVAVYADTDRPLGAL